MIYFAWAVIGLFFCFGVIPTIVSTMGVNSYIECLKLGLGLTLGLATFAALLAVLSWSALYVLGY
jgi:hypothetical protein